MQNLEASCEDGERPYKKLKINHPTLPSYILPQSTNSDLEETSQPPKFCIFSKLLELHHEECYKNNDETRPGLKHNSFLLEKLVTRERLNTLIINLYPGNKGYSFAFRTVPRWHLDCDDTANMSETVFWPYEDDDLLRYIDNEQLPPHLLDLFESHCSFLFYNGCIIAEVRDYRRAYPNYKCEIHHVLLRPTLKSILADVENLVEEKEEWGLEERHIIESQLLLANNPHIYLGPDNSASVSHLRLNHNRNMWTTNTFRRMAKKFSQVTVNRKRKLDLFTHRPGLELYEYINRVRSGSAKMGTIQIPKKEEIRPIPVPNLDPPANIAPPASGVSIKEFKMYQPPKESSDYLPQLVEEYILETEMPSKNNSKRVYYIKLSILQRPSNFEYLGELYLDRDHKENERNGVACRFTLGSRLHATKYVQQFTETFTKSGRQNVKMLHNPGFKMLSNQTQQQNNSAKSSTSVSSSLPHPPQPQMATNCQPSTSVTNTILNGAVTAAVTPVQNQVFGNISNVSVLQSHLQGSSLINKSATQTTMSSADYNHQLKINALAIELMNSSQQFQAKANAKQAQQRQQQQQAQQQKISNSHNTATLNSILNSPPASNINSEASAVVVNALNNTPILPQQIQTVGQQKPIARKMTLMNVANARVLNQGNLIVNNNRYVDLNNLTSMAQPQQITLASVNNNEFNYATIPIKHQQQQQQRNIQRVTVNSAAETKNAALSACLVDTPAADRPDIVNSNSDSLLLERLVNSSNSFVQKTGQFVVQTSKANTVLSPLTSPQQSTGTINIQGIKFQPLQGLTGVQNVQVQLPGFSQPISVPLNVPSQGQQVIVTLPITSGTGTATASQAASNGTNVNTIGINMPTVVLTNASSSNFAQLLLKNQNQQGIRNVTPSTVQIQQGQPFQLITTQIPRTRMQQTNFQQNIASRTIQRTQITGKMSNPQANASQVLVNSRDLSQLPKQMNVQHMCQNQPQVGVAQGINSARRRSSNFSDSQ